jgi:5-(carboxyamino)imidazole ribonucleotide synthase
MILGVLGAGQLGRMLGLAAVPLDIRCRFLDHTPHAPAAATGELITGDFEDPAALDRFMDGLDACTLEFENVPVAALEHVAAKVPTFPGPLALRTAQDRALEKACFTELNIPTTRYELADKRDQLEHAIKTIGAPCVVKSRRLGYDGKGQCVVRGSSPAEIDAAWGAVHERPCIIEEFIAFEREVSIIGARGLDGSCVFYPLTQNEHRAGILRVSRAPAPPGDTDDLQAAAESALRRVMDHLGYVGVLTIEFFVSNRTAGISAGLIANEMAPRVHNSGHWTIEGATCSQFENHLRAVCGLPLQSPRCRPSAMVNLIGAAPTLNELLLIPGARVHLYGKSPRAGRKIGHVTLVGDSHAELNEPLRILSGMAAAAEQSAC